MPVGRRAQAAVAQHAAQLAEGQAGLAREHDVGDRADAADDGLGGELAPARCSARRAPRARRPRSARPRRRR